MTIRAPGRAVLTALTTSRPLPSPSRRSTTEEAGACAVAAVVPAETLSAVETTKPRRSIARAGRWQSSASSSTIRSVRSLSDRPRRGAASMVSEPAGRVRSVVFIGGSSLFSFQQPGGLSVFCSLAARGIFGCDIRSRFCLQIGTVPGNDNMRGALDEIVEGQVGAAALQEALRDEDAEPHRAGLAGAGREIRLAQPAEQMGGKAGPVIGDLDGDRRCVPEDRHADLASGELHGVLDEVVEPVHDLWAAPDQRLGLRWRAGRRADQPGARGGTGGGRRP